MMILRHKYLFLSISGTLVLVSMVFLLGWGLKPGIDFTGGSLLEVEFASTPPLTDEVRAMVETLGVGRVVVQPTGEAGLLLRFKEVDEETHQQILARLRAPQGGNLVAVVEKRFDTIGPVVGQELKQRSVLALVLAIAAIILYITWSFRRVSRPVSSWKYGLAAIIALVHDVAIPTGIFVVLGRTRGVEVDLLFITALLTILGFSVHDTIVVFDRIRENLKNLKRPEPYEVTVGRSLAETMTRSINTSLTVLLVLIALLAWGGSTTTYFALALLVGVVAGTYSSLCVASPLLVVWDQLTKKSS